MKINIKNLKMNDNDFNVEINDIEMDLPLSEVKEIIELNIANKVIRQMTDKFPPAPIVPVKDCKKEFLYIQGHEEPLIPAEVNEIVYIKPAEYCILGTDSIHYHEFFDGKVGVITRIDLSENKILLKLNEAYDHREIYVHPHWLKQFKP